jgi:DNA-binding protein
MQLTMMIHQNILKYCGTAATIWVVLIVLLFSFHAGAENVYVKYRGQVDLKSFECSDITRSSFIERVCFDKKNQYMVISLNGTYYHYCEIGSNTVSELLAAASMGRFYNSEIKGRYDCRTHAMPSYN